MLTYVCSCLCNCFQVFLVQSGAKGHHSSMLLGPGEVRAARGSHTAFALGTFLQCTLTAVASSCFPAPLLLFLCSVLIKDVLGTQLQTSRMFLGSLVVFFHHRWAARMIPNAVPSPALGHPRAEEIGAAEPAGGQPGARGTNLPGFGIHGAVAGGVIGCGSNHWVSFGLQGLWLPMMAPSSFR